jgi:hypothetical protein
MMAWVSGNSLADPATFDELLGLWLASAVGLMGYHHGRRLLETTKRTDFTLLLEALLLGLAITIIAACIEGEFTLKWVIGRYV